MSQGRKKKFELKDIKSASDIDNHTLMKLVVAELDSIILENDIEFPREINGELERRVKTNKIGDIITFFKKKKKIYICGKIIKKRGKKRKRSEKNNKKNHIGDSRDSGPNDSPSTPTPNSESSSSVVEIISEYQNHPSPVSSEAFQLQPPLKKRKLKFPGDNEFELPIYCLMVDEDHINTPFGVTYCEHEYPDEESGDGKEVWLKTTHLFPSQIKKVYETMDNFKNNYNWSFFFNETNDKLSGPKGMCQGQWETSELYPLTSKTITSFKKLFEENELESVYEDIDNFIEEREDLQEDDFSFFVPSLQNESNWYVKNRGRPKGVKNGQGRRKKESKEKQKRYKWLHQEEVKLIMILKDKNYICTGWNKVLIELRKFHMVTPMYIKGSHVRTKYFTLVQKWLKEDFVYEREEFVKPPHMDEDDPVLLQMKESWEKNEDKRAEEIETCKEIIRKIETNKMGLNSLENYTENEIREKIINRARERQLAKHDTLKNVSDGIVKDQEIQMKYQECLEKQREVDEKKLEFEDRRFELEKRNTSFQMFSALREMFRNSENVQFDEMKCARECGIDLEKFGVNFVE